MEMDEKYIPKVGHLVSAKRKKKSRIYTNFVCGPVVDVWTNACRVVTNKGTEIEGDFKLYFSVWDFWQIENKAAFVVLLKRLMIDENGYTEDDAEAKIKKHYNIVMQGIMKGPLALRATVIALEMQD